MNAEQALEVVQVKATKLATCEHEAAIAISELAEIESVVGDDPSAQNVKSWRTAREKSEIAALCLRAATRAIEGARIVLDRAEVSEAHETKERLSPSAHRWTVFNDCAAHIATLATPFDESTATPEEIGSNAIAQAAARAAIAERLAEQVDAIQRLGIAYARLGETPPATKAVTPDHILAAVEIARAESQRDPDEETFRNAIRRALENARGPFYMYPGITAPQAPIVLPPRPCSRDEILSAARSMLVSLDFVTDIAVYFQRSSAA